MKTFTFVGKITIFVETEFSFLNIKLEIWQE